MSKHHHNADEPGRSLHEALAALIFVGVMLAGAWQIMSAARHPDGLTFPRTCLDFRQGRTTQSLEKELDHKLPARADLIAAANSVRYLLTGGGGEQVRMGRDDWLFLTDELRFDADGATHLNARAELLGSAARSLDAQGVKLVIALVPDKARVYAAKLSGGHYPEYHRSRYLDGLTALRRLQVNTVDLLTPLSQAATRAEVYYRSDTHWNQTGAQIAAQAVAQAVGQLGVELEPTQFTSANEGGSTERPGDLIRLMGLQDMPNALRPKPDQETQVLTRQSSADNVSGGLFGDVGVPVVLTGTSYSMRGNFHGYLQQALTSKVLNSAKDGGGFLQSTTAYLKDDAFRSAKPKVLIWEVPERFLRTPLDGEPGWLSKVNLKP